MQDNNNDFNYLKVSDIIKQLNGSYTDFTQDNEQDTSDRFYNNTIWNY